LSKNDTKTVEVKFNKVANETNPKILFKRFNELEMEIVSLKKVIKDNETYRSSITKMRTNFSQRLGAIFVDEVFIKTKWVNDRIKPSENEVTEMVNNFSKQLKGIIDNLKPINEEHKNFTTIKRDNSAFIINKEDERIDKQYFVKQYSNLPYHHRLIKIFFEELENSDYYKNSKEHFDKLTDLKEEREFVNSKLDSILNKMAA